MSRAVDADEKRWKAESDALTLAEAEQIKADTRRSAAARKAAMKMADDAKERANSFSKIASKPTTKSNTRIPGKKK